MGTAEKEIRLLRADEIECRVSTINEKGLSLLLFKDARVDQKILDETFTPFGWKRSHQVIDGNLYCTVEIWDGEKKQWIAKQDVGTMSYSEKEKGQASDSFKRACFNWGVGRELYTAPFIWVPAGRVRIEQRGEKYYTGERFMVRSINYNENREICSLSIINSAKQEVFVMGQTDNICRQQKTGLTPRHMAALKKELQRTGVQVDTVLERYHIQTMEQMTDEIYKKAMDCLKKSKDKQVA